MKIALFQQDIVWLDQEANYRKIEELLAIHPEIDLLVLPEMFTTGFVLDPHPGDLASHTETVARLKDLSCRYHAALCGSVAVTDGSQAFNRAYFVTPQGEAHWSDKRHPFNVGGERRIYTAGQQKTIVEYDGIRFLLLVCYDLRFPVWSRWTREEPYDILICVANWPSARQLAWDTLLPARAIENQSYAIGVNRVGEDQLCPYAGGTRAIHPYGHALAQCDSATESLTIFEPDMEKLRSYHDKFPAWTDADTFHIDQ